MQTQVAIVGGGVGGTVVANRLMHLFQQQSHHSLAITVYDRRGIHTYHPGWLHLPFAQQHPDQLKRDEFRLLDQRVTLLTGNAGRVEQIDINAKHLRTADGLTHPYDFIVIATGARNDFDEIPGFETGAHHFYSEDAALRLRQELADFVGGRVIVGASRLPYRCPPAPIEFTFMLDDHLRHRGLRDKTEVHYVYPLENIFPIASVAEFALPLMRERNITFHTSFSIASIDPEKNRITTDDGESLDYNLLILTPPHRGARLVELSGLGDSNGWIPTDHQTLRLLGHEDSGAFALGDATNLGFSKLGAAAHFEGFVVAEQIAARIEDRTPRRYYDGRAACFLETGRNQASFFWYDDARSPRPARPSRLWLLEKAALNRFYWQVVPPAYGRALR
jgi:sulfide:quinone oxidoreductase